MAKLSRRQFVRFSMMGVSTTVVSTGLGGMLTGCSGDDDIENNVPASFENGVASGDPLNDRVILWTRVTPEDETVERVRVEWQVATDESFSNPSLVVTGAAMTDADRDFTMKVDATGLTAGSVYYYRFLTANNVSPTGRTKTLPEGETDQAKFVVMSCSNYPAGFFHAYAEAARQDDIDAVIHLGDYIYEYERGGFADENAAAIGRASLPPGELFTLSDYRTRYAQYRSDPNLLNLHASMPMIAVWDDHEVANDTWREGAENHDDATEGSFAERLMVALQAYAEWMPVRSPVDTDVNSLSRSFQFGDLVNLMMLDTRIVGRDVQLPFSQFFTAEGAFDAERYAQDIGDTNRTLLGADQLSWLQGEINNSETIWQVLGQQVLMGRMELPGAVATAQLSIPDFAMLGQLAQIAQTNPELLTPEQLADLQARGPLLALPNLPYNLDAWDGYPAEREQLFETARSNNANLVVLAGDTHNAWANSLKLAGDENANVGIEFATPGVSSPGLESFLNLTTPQAVAATEGGVIQLIRDLHYANFSDRGFLTVTFTRENVTADWTFVSSVQEPTYTVLENRAQQITVPVGRNSLS